MKVTVSVHGRFHAFDLARRLLERGMLAGLITTYPPFAVRRFLSPPVMATCPWLEAARRLHDRWGIGPAPGAWLGESFSRFAARRLPEGTDILVGWSGATLHAMEKARACGARVVIERGSSHIAHQAAVLAAAADRHGLPLERVEPRAVAVEEEEYAAADLIAVPTGFSRRTFLERGIPPERILVNPYGVDLSRFSARPPRPPGGPVRLLFVGRVGVRKGVPDLLAAVRRLGGSVTLRLVGPVEEGMAPLLADHPQVEVVGPLPGSALPAEYTAADVFVLPSLEEGLPLVLLQAMASGRPVVATPETGAEDVVTHGTDGLIVPASDAESLASALADLAADPYRRDAMGTAARRRVEVGLDWHAYGERAVAAYFRLLGQEPPCEGTA